MLKALVVEDDDQIRAMLAKVVERQDFEVDLAIDGVEAIEQLDAHDYAVIVLDLMMPRVDGYGVLRHMKKMYPDKLSRTIIATAVPESEVRRAIELPVYRVHGKPFNLPRLIDDIRRCVDQNGSEPR
jgi:CheY-like chemotaxis protein